jgi:hypothetical protein
VVWGGTMSRESVFRAFSREQFLNSPSWTHIGAILKTNGGSYGISGARGAGKTWLMLRSIEEVEGSGGLGLWYPSPSEYESTAFLSSLADSLATRIQRAYSYLVGKIRTRQFQVRLSAVVIAIIVLVFSALSFLQYRDYLRSRTADLESDLQGTEKEISRINEQKKAPPENLLLRRDDLREQIAQRSSTFAPSLGRWTRLEPAFPLILIGLIVLYVASELYHLRQNSRPEVSLFKYATETRERLRYSISLKQSSESGLDGGARGVTARIKRMNERALAERPLTLSSLVYEFRELARYTASVVRPASLVVTLDELDKLENQEAARALLRDIKGVFDVPGVHYLVSVSDEAAGALQLGPIHGRNEFNSSFYTVIRLAPLTPSETLELLKSRKTTLNELVILGLNILSGGNPRELLRLTDLVQSALSENTEEDNLLPTSMMLVMRSEVRALLEEVLASGNSKEALKLTDVEKLEAWRSLPDQYFRSIASFIRLTRTAPVESWTPQWATVAWERVFQEPWRRLLVRLFVAGALSSEQSLTDVPSALDLQELIITNSQSAGVGRLMLEERFGSDLSELYKPPERLTIVPVSQE